MELRFEPKRIKDIIRPATGLHDHKTPLGEDVVISPLVEAARSGTISGESHRGLSVISDRGDEQL